MSQHGLHPPPPLSTPPPISYHHFHISEVFPVTLAKHTALDIEAGLLYVSHHSIIVTDPSDEKHLKLKLTSVRRYAVHGNSFIFESGR